MSKIILSTYGLNLSIVFGISVEDVMNFMVKYRHFELMKAVFADKKIFNWESSIGSANAEIVKGVGEVAVALLRCKSI